MFKQADGVKSEAAGVPEVPADVRAGRSVTIRAVLLGLVGVIATCVLAPFNDFALANTYLIGNFLPIAVVLAILLLVLAVNAPLHKLAPRFALRAGELAVAISMMLAACAIPTSGFMRYVPATLIGIHSQSADDGRFAEAMRTAGVRDWVLPSFNTTDPADRGAEDIARNYWGRNTEQSGLAAVPWRAWLRPAVAWGALAAALWGACLCLSVLVHHQWARNERLAFPLAGVYVALLAPPEPGRALNATFRSPGFWIAAGAVFLMHGFVGLHAYFPQNVPNLRLEFDFNQMFSERPLSDISWYVKKQAIYFTIIGICFFLQSKVSFSLWASIVVLDVILVVGRGANISMSSEAEQDQNLGAMIAFAATIAWVGRAHWAMIVRRMFGAKREADPKPEFISYGPAGWGLVVCLVGMVVWIAAAGASVTMAIYIVGFMLLCYLLLTRVVAETGLVFAQLRGLSTRFMQYPLLWAKADPVRVDNSSAFTNIWLNQNLIHDARENPLTFQNQAFRLADESIDRGDRRSRVSFILVLALAMAVGYIASGASTLVLEYNVGATLGAASSGPINKYGIADSSANMLNAYIAYTTSVPTESHSWWGHLLGGAGLAGVLGFLRLQFSWWPFHPVGYLLVYSYPMRMIWFSVFIGWLVKTIVVRFGGAPMMRRMTPVAIGLIVGECAAIALWLIVCVVMYLTGNQYFAIGLLPG
jgi:hypothetical protein